MASTKNKKVILEPSKVDSSLIQTPSRVPRSEVEKKGAYPQTIVKVEEAAKMISKGKGRAEVIEHLQKKYDMSYATAQNYFVSACHFLIPDDQAGFKEGLIKQNIERLEKIINDSLEEKQYKTAREAIDTLNKTLGAYGQGSSIVINKNNEGDEQIIVNFGG